MTYTEAVMVMLDMLSSPELTENQRAALQLAVSVLSDLEDQQT